MGSISLSLVKFKGFNSLSHVEKKGSILWVIIFSKKKFHEYWKEVKFLNGHTELKKEFNS